MDEKTPTSRRRFDSATLVPQDLISELPLEPLPPEPVEDQPPVVRPTDAPVMVLPIGEIDESLVRKVMPSVQQAFGRPIVYGQSLPVPKYAYNPTREQFHSAAILKRVETARIDDWDAAVGIVNVDLFVPEVPFIFGEADRSTRSAIISLVRLCPEVGTPESKLDLTAKRLMSELIHQIGLIRGLAHCPNNRCVMFPSAAVQDTDKKGTQFCANCRKRLAAER